jgi:UDPglucose 6-dehydrogenase
MVKHALNSFLALSITFINEIAGLGEHLGADAKEVSAGLKTDPRIGPKAYLSPGGPFAGGTLARDVVALVRLAESKGETAPVISAIKESNDRHRGWTIRQLQSQLGNLKGKTIAVLGLTYTTNTDTLRRSTAIELCQNLMKAGANINAFDPVVKCLPTDLAAIRVGNDIAEALRNADAAVICTEWLQFGEADWATIIAGMRRRLIIDPNRFLENELKNINGVEHLSVGRVA